MAQDGHRHPGSAGRADLHRGGPGDHRRTAGQNRGHRRCGRCLRRHAGRPAVDGPSSRPGHVDRRGRGIAVRRAAQHHAFLPDAQRDRAAARTRPAPCRGIRACVISTDPDVRSPWPARRAVTSHPLSSASPSKRCARAGNAVDAALTAWFAAPVLGPTTPGPAGLLALVWRADMQSLHALNGAGCCTAGLERLGPAGRAHRPHRYGGHPFSRDPGALDARAACWRDHGTRSLAEILEPTIDYAERHGTRRSARPKMARRNRQAAARRGRMPPPADAGGRAPARRAISCASPRSPGLAHDCLRGHRRLLSRLARQGDGVLAPTTRRHARRPNFRRLASFCVEPIQTRHRGLDIVQMPPAGKADSPADAQHPGGRSIIRASSRPARGSDFTCRSRRAFRQASTARARRLCRRPRIRRGPGAGTAVRALRGAPVQRIDPRRAMPAQIVLPGIGQSDTRSGSLGRRWRGQRLVPGSARCSKPLSAREVCPQTGVACEPPGESPGATPATSTAVDRASGRLHTIIPAIAMRDGRPALSFGVMGWGPYKATGRHSYCRTS